MSATTTNGFFTNYRESLMTEVNAGKLPVCLRVLAFIKHTTRMPGDWVLASAGEIASMLGVRRASVSSALHQLESSGIISSRWKIGNAKEYRYGSIDADERCSENRTPTQAVAINNDNQPDRYSDHGMIGIPYGTCTEYRSGDEYNPLDCHGLEAPDTGNSGNCSATRSRETARGSATLRKKEEEEQPKPQNRFGSNGEIGEDVFEEHRLQARGRLYLPDTNPNIPYEFLSHGTIADGYDVALIWEMTYRTKNQTKYIWDKLSLAAIADSFEQLKNTDAFMINRMMSEFLSTVPNPYDRNDNLTRYGHTFKTFMCSLAKLSRSVGMRHYSRKETESFFSNTEYTVHLMPVDLAGLLRIDTTGMSETVVDEINRRISVARAANG